VNPLTLHSAARRWLLHRHQHLRSYHETLVDWGRIVEEYVPAPPTPDAEQATARRSAADAILVEVERLDQDRLPDVGGLRTALLRAADLARPDAAPRAKGSLPAAADADERRRFREFVAGWAGDDLPDTPPLPYRRVLSDTESASRQRQLADFWGLSGKLWHPMIAEDVPPDVLIVTGEAVWDGPGTELARAALRAAGVARVTELREWGPEYLLDLDLFAPRYTGAEGVWSDDTLSWIAYASHEGTVAFGGSLAAALVEEWADLDDWRWRGWRV
jgi:hypothetical protein